jgi:hypothetical protein
MDASNILDGDCHVMIHLLFFVQFDENKQPLADRNQAWPCALHSQPSNGNGG